MKTKSNAGSMAMLMGTMAAAINVLIWLFFGFVRWDFSITSRD
jgi:hypothetical protein